jgi:NAD(P)H-quinone oxidoreductase subunit 5
VPFHTWLLASMTAPTPASALMHAGFVNAGGILLVRFAPVVAVEWLLLAVLVVGAASALLGKLMKSVQPDVKSQLACSTTGQMGFMIMQAGLGFFGAAITHLVLHGFYKAYLFLAAGNQIEQTRPDSDHDAETTGLVGGFVTLLSGVTGGALFALLTGKGTTLDSGLLLTGLVALTTLHATRTAVRRTALPAPVRYGAIPLVLLPAIAVYAGAYLAISGLLQELPLATAPTELTVVHIAVAAAFALVYVAIETEAYQRSRRLYVTLLNMTRPPAETVLTSTEEYNEY